jgi:rhodanese-related sulfurtransferase
LIVAPEGKATETVKRLARVGYDNALGYLEGGIAAWQASGKEVDQIETIDVNDLQKAYQSKKVDVLLDVRKESEYALGHVTTAHNWPLNDLNLKMAAWQKTPTYYLHCGSGYRSTIASSILKARGHDNLVNVQGPVADILSQLPSTTGVEV